MVHCLVSHRDLSWDSRSSVSHVFAIIWHGTRTTKWYHDPSTFPCFHFTDMSRGQLCIALDDVLYPTHTAAGGKLSPHLARAVKFAALVDLEFSKFLYFLGRILSDSAQCIIQSDILV